MKPFFRCALAVLLLVVVSSLRAADKSLDHEAIGPIMLGQKAAALIKLLGQPTTKDEDQLMGASGEWVQIWHFPKQGLELQMSSGKKGGAKTVEGVTAGAGCNLATTRGIKIGAPVAAVRKAYGDVEEKTQSRSGESFVAGSVYGGVIFHLKAGKVESIFLGAAAE